MISTVITSNLIYEASKLEAINDAARKSKLKEKANQQYSLLDEPSNKSKNDSIDSYEYKIAKACARYDAKIRVEVPAKNGRKAYSYYREGKSATEETNVRPNQIPRPMPSIQVNPHSTQSTDTKTAEADLHQLMNIRDLKEEARNRGILRYSYMTRDQLQSSIKIHDADPEHRENIRKSLQHQKDLETLKKVKSSEVGRAIGSVNPTLGRQYNLLSAIARKYKKNPTEALIYSLPAIAGTTKAVMFLLKQKRASNIKESAGAATNDADSYRDDIDENNVPQGVNFYVGGYGRGSKDLHDRVANSPFASKEDADWIKDKAENIEIKRTGEENHPHNTAQSVINNIATGYQVTINNTLHRGKSKESVELAAKLYAQGTKWRVDKNGVKSMPALQVLAAEDGGVVARDALEILQQMPKGAAIAKRVKLVTLGTPYFGESKIDVPEVNLMGDGDPWGALPFNKGNQTKRASGVSGSSQSDYTASADVLGKVFNNMRSGLSDRTHFDADSVKEAASAQKKSESQQEKEASQANAAADRVGSDKARAEKQAHVDKLIRDELKAHAGNSIEELERLIKDPDAFAKAKKKGVAHIHNDQGKTGNDF